MNNKNYYSVLFFVLLISLFPALTYSDSNLKPITKEDLNNLKFQKNKGEEKDYFDDNFDRARKMFEHMNQMFEDDDFFSFRPSFNFKNKMDDDLKISENEDSKNKYIDIEAQGFDTDGLKIGVQKGMIDISGEIEKKTEDKNDKGWSKSSYISKFHKSFPIPSGVDESKVEFEKSKSKIRLKFPKT